MFRSTRHPHRRALVSWPSWASLALGTTLSLLCASALAETSTRAAPDDRPILVSARNLTQMGVHTADRREIGSVRYVLVRLHDGDVRGLAIDRQTSETTLAVVPWSAFGRALQGGRIHLGIDEQKLSGAPAYDEARLADFTEPAVWTTIVGHWQPLSAVSAEVGSDGPGALAHVLVGRSIVSTIDGPAFQLASEVSGSPVIAADGTPFGEIDEIVIDWHQGVVAYVVIAQDGFLSWPEAWFAVPLSVLRWRQDLGALQLSVPATDLRESGALDGSRTPMRVRRGDLERLYDRFGVEPYWMGKSERRNKPTSVRPEVGEPSQPDASAR